MPHFLVFDRYGKPSPLTCAVADDWKNAVGVAEKRLSLEVAKNSACWLVKESPAQYCYHCAPNLFVKIRRYMRIWYLNNVK